MSGVSEDSITQHLGHIHPCCRTRPVLLPSNLSQTDVKAAPRVSIQHRGIAPCRPRRPYRARQDHRPRISILPIILRERNYIVLTLLPREHVKTLRGESHSFRKICVPRQIRIRCPRCSRGVESDDAGSVTPRVGRGDELPWSRRRVALVEGQEGLGVREKRHLIGKRATMRREGGVVGPGRVTWDRVESVAFPLNIVFGEVCGRSGKGGREGDEECEDEEGGALEQVHLESKAGIEREDSYIAGIKNAYERQMNIWS